MPLVHLRTSASLPASVKTRLLADLSRACAEIIGKPEAYVMSVVDDGVAMLFAGEPGPTALVEVRSIGGLGPAVNGRLARRVGELVTAATGAPGARTYASFTDVPASDWAHDGETFG